MEILELYDAGKISLQQLKSYFIEKVAAGLRRLDTCPDAILLIHEFGEHLLHDLSDEICGLPVYSIHGGLMRTSYVHDNAEDCMYFPIWKSDTGDYYMETDWFIRGFSEYCPDWYSRIAEAKINIPSLFSFEEQTVTENMAI